MTRTNLAHGVTPLEPSPTDPDLDGALRALGEIASLVEGCAAESDRRRQLAAAVVGAATERRLFRLLLPAALGGAEFAMRDFFRVVDAAARLDGSFGWNLCVANVGVDLVARSVDPRTRVELADEPELLLAGAIRPGAVSVEQVEGGHVFHGRIGFASGAAHASHFLTAGAIGEAPGVGIGGVMRCGLVPRAQVEIVDSWHVSGLRATSSSDVLLHEVFVPDRFTFDLAPDEMLGRLPFASRLGSGLCCVGLGIATRALDRLVALATSRSRFGATVPLVAMPDVQVAAGRARGLIESGRAYLETAHREVTEQAEMHMPTEDELARLRLCYVTATHNAIAATDLVWEAAGSAALYEDEGLERCWRDVHAVGQHAMVSSRHLSRLGQITLGQPAGRGPI